MILITGAAGNIGRELVKLLGQTGGSFRVLVRKPEKFRSPGEQVQVAQGHFGDSKQIAEAMTGIDQVFLLSGVHPDMVRLQGAAIDAARRAGVRHVVKLSAIDADPASPLTLNRWHGEIEAMLIESGMTWTMLQPNSFYQNLLFNARAIAATGNFAQAAGDGRVSLVDARDIAAAAFAVLTRAVPENRSFTLTGPAALHYDEVASAIAAVSGVPVRYVRQTDAEALASMVAGGMPAWWAELLVELAAHLAAGAGSRVSDDVLALTGRPAGTLDKFLRDHGAAFAPAFARAPAGTGGA